MPEVVTGQPARSAIWRAMLNPVAPSGLAQPMSTSSTVPGSSFARSIACLTACAPSVAPCVRLNAPRQDLASGVRAVETMTASTTAASLFRFGGRRILESLAGRGELRNELRGFPAELLHAPRDRAETDTARVEHRPAALHRKTITGEIDHIDVRRALRDAFLQDLRAFVDQRIQQAIDDLGVGNLARFDFECFPLFFDDLV